MLYSLKEIKKLRIKSGINQKELAQQAGVSQSLIAKIEAGKIEPTYTKACRILETLSRLNEKEEIKAKDILNRKICFAQPEEKIKEIIKTMKLKGISQMPVLKNNLVCGLISEKNIIDQIADGKNIKEKKVEEVMDECPPIISQETKQKTILEILKEHPLILVAEKGEIIGLISKSDLLFNL